MDYYPIYLNLQGRLCVVVGGGKVAEGKVVGLLAAAARARVVAPTLTSALERLACDGQIEHLARVYRPGDLADAFLAISATDEPEVNEKVWQEANASGLLVNVVDDASRCNFIAPAILRQGDLAVAISTSGKAPALAVRLREQFEHLVGPEHARFLQLAGSLRERLAAQRPSFAERRALWYQLVDSDVLGLLRNGDEGAARLRMAEIMGVAPEA
jgi:precorrin-2 dehydrogenase/sirohydrochlorin ferrochelatase